MGSKARKVEGAEGLADLVQVVSGQATHDVGAAAELVDFEGVDTGHVRT
jgi:hypothetical protein